MTKTVLVLLAGSSCTGKSTFVSALRNSMDNVVTIGQDDFMTTIAFKTTRAPWFVALRLGEFVAIWTLRILAINTIKINY